MVATYQYSVSGTFVTPSGGTNGASVDAWRSSRFGSTPAQGAPPPSGTADAGIVITGPSFGGPGSWIVQCPTNEQYYVRVQYGGTSYWGLASPAISTDGVPGGQVISSINDTGGQVFNVAAYGAFGNGFTDDTAAIQAAVTACYNAGGGTVFFGPIKGFPADYLLKSTITIPTNPFAEAVYTPGSPPIYRSVPMRFTGTGASKNPRGDAPTDCSVISFQPTSATIMIEGLGEGTFEFDHLTVEDGSSFSNLFFYFTNTVSNIHDCSFIGNETFNSCWTDLVQYGAAAATNANGGTNAIFQGYGSQLVNNGLQGMRHMALLYTAANSVTIQGNNIYNTCGTNLGSDAPIILAGTSTFPIYGCTVTGNTLEMGGGTTSGAFAQTGYAYGIKCSYASRNNFISNGIWDVGSSSTFVSGMYFDSNSAQNVVIDTRDNPGIVWATGNQVNNLQLHAVPQLNGTGFAIGGGTPPQPQNGGYFIQAGTVTATTNSSGQFSVNFPAAFPNGVLTVNATCNGTNNASNAGICWVGQVFNVSTSSFTVFMQAPTGSTANENASWSVSWQAIGY